MLKTSDKYAMGRCISIRLIRSMRALLLRYLTKFQLEFVHLWSEFVRQNNRTAACHVCMCACVRLFVMSSTQINDNRLLYYISFALSKGEWKRCMHHCQCRTYECLSLSATHTNWTLFCLWVTAYRFSTCATCMSSINLLIITPTSQPRHAWIRSPVLRTSFISI